MGDGIIGAKVAFGIERESSAREGGFGKEGELRGGMGMRTEGFDGGGNNGGGGGGGGATNGRHGMEGV